MINQYLPYRNIYQLSMKQYNILMKHVYRSLKEINLVHVFKSVTMKYFDYDKNEHRIHMNRTSEEKHETIQFFFGKEITLSKGWKGYLGLIENEDRFHLITVMQDNWEKYFKEHKEELFRELNKCMI